MTIEELRKQKAEIDEAIKYAEEVADGFDETAQEIAMQDENGVYQPRVSWYQDRASSQRQIAEWLKALKEIWDSGCCNDCRNGQCEWKPKLGQLVRFNCPHYVGVANGEVNADDS